MISYSVIVPVYNSAETLNELAERLSNVFIKKNLSYEIILIDDGSVDESWATIEKIKENKKFILTGIKFSKNFGQHNAILCGIIHSKGEQIITIDDDLQFPPEEINKLIDCYEKTNADLIYGIPQKRKHSFLRNFGRNILKFFHLKIIPFLTGKFTKAPTEGSSFRLIKKNVCNKMTQEQQNIFYLLDWVISWYTSKIEVVSINHQLRKSGKTGYTFLKIISTYINRMINYTAWPLKAMTFGGLFLSIITFLIGIRFIYRKIIYDVPIGYTSIIVTVLFSTSLILFCLGIIGEYLYKLYHLQNKKPTFFIQKIV